MYMYDVGDILIYDQPPWQGSEQKKKTQQGDSRNVSRPVAYILMEANIGQLPTKFGYNQMHGWKVINRYRILQVNFTYDLWPTYVTFDPRISRRTI